MNKKIMVDPVKIMLPDGTELNSIGEEIIPGRITSFVGGGGKTHSMFAMGKELAGKGQKVIMTTTTKIRPFKEPFPDLLFCVGEKDEQGKLRSVKDPDILKKQCDYLLIEADGSRGLPVKAPENHEPVITENTDLVIAVAGLMGVGRPIIEVGHRVERICNLLGKKPSDLVTEEDFAILITSEYGLRKNVSDRRYAVILNQADDEEKQEMGRKIASMLWDRIPCIMTSYALRPVSS